MGYEITRTGKEYISIKRENSKAIRLKGKYYKEDWSEKPSKLGSSNTIFKALQKEIEKASRYNQKLFYKTTDTSPKTKRSAPSARALLINITVCSTPILTSS